MCWQSVAQVIEPVKDVVPLSANPIGVIRRITSPRKLRSALGKALSQNDLAGRITRALNTIERVRNPQNPKKIRRINRSVLSHAERDGRISAALRRAYVFVLDEALRHHFPQWSVQIDSDEFRFTVFSICANDKCKKLFELERKDQVHCPEHRR